MSVIAVLVRTKAFYREAPSFALPMSKLTYEVG